MEVANTRSTSVPRASTCIFQLQLSPNRLRRSADNEGAMRSALTRDYHRLHAFTQSKLRHRSLPIRDEPEGGVSFQYKMSLGGHGMLRIDNQRTRSRETEPGSDRGFSKS